MSNGLLLGGAGGASGSAAPTVPAQTFSFGRFTIASAGAISLTGTTGSITSITLGTRTLGADHFSTSGTNIVRNGTATPGGGLDNTYTWTGCTATGPGGTSSAFNITINTVASAYTYANKTELDNSIAALITANVTGRSLLGRNVGITIPLDDAILTTKAFPASTVLTSHDNANRTTFTGIDIKNCQNLKLYQVRVTNTSGDLNLVTLSGLTDAVTVEDCEIYGYQTLDASGATDYSGGYQSTNAMVGVNTRNSSGYPIAVTVKDCNIHDVKQGIQIYATGACLIQGNTIDRHYETAITTSNQVVGASMSILWNNIQHPISLPTDTNAPAADGIQALGNASYDTRNLIIRGNRMVRGISRGYGNGIYLRGNSAGIYFDSTLIEANFTDYAGINGISIDRAKNTMVRNNTVASTYASSAAASRIEIGVTQQFGPQNILDNVAELINYFGGVYQYNNIVTGLLGATIAYATVYTGGTFTEAGNDTLANSLTNFAMKVAGPADGTINAGAFGTGYADYSAKTYTAPRTVDTLNITPMGLTVGF